MLEVLKSMLPMILAVVFVYTAAMFAAMAIKRKQNRLTTSVAAIVIELISFTIWIPSLGDLFDAIGLALKTRQIAMLISVMLILFGTAVAILLEVNRKET